MTLQLTLRTKAYPEAKMLVIWCLGILSMSYIAYQSPDENPKGIIDYELCSDNDQGCLSIGGLYLGSQFLGYLVPHCDEDVILGRQLCLLYRHEGEAADHAMVAAPRDLIPPARPYKCKPL